MFRNLADKLPFTRATEKLLHGLVIGDNQPGTILRDFEMMLGIFKIVSKPSHLLINCHWRSLPRLTSR